MHWPCIDSMLSQRPGRWLNIVSMRWLHALWKSSSLSYINSMLGQRNRRWPGIGSTPEFISAVLSTQTDSHKTQSCARSVSPANTTPWINAGFMLAHRLRRWTNIKPALVQGVVLAGFRWSRRTFPRDLYCEGFPLTKYISLKWPLIPKSNVRQYSTTTSTSRPIISATSQNSTRTLSYQRRVCITR